MFNVKPFKIDVQQTVLDDLQNRLHQTRWPETPENIGWKYGTDPVFLKSLVGYWQTVTTGGQEAALNKFPQFTVEIDGLTIHFPHDQRQRLQQQAPAAFSRMARLFLPLL